MAQRASTAPATLEQAQEMGLRPEEFDLIKEILGRTPNFTEMCIYSVMWSEHCSYKNSIKWLKTLPKDGPHLLVKAGEENAGIVDIGDGVGCAFKIESHNHPSALEPYQGRRPAWAASTATSSPWAPGPLPSSIPSASRPSRTPRQSGCSTASSAASATTATASACRLWAGRSTSTRCIRSIRFNA